VSGSIGNVVTEAGPIVQGATLNRPAFSTELSQGESSVDMGALWEPCHETASDAFLGGASCSTDANGEEPAKLWRSKPASRLAGPGASDDKIRADDCAPGALQTIGRFDCDNCPEILDQVRDPIGHGSSLISTTDRCLRSSSAMMVSFFLDDVVDHETAKQILSDRLHQSCEPWTFVDDGGRPLAVLGVDRKADGTVFIQADLLEFSCKEIEEVLNLLVELQMWLGGTLLESKSQSL